MDARIQAALEIIDRDFAQPLTVARLARQVGLSGSHFRRLFRQETGTTFKRRLGRLRMAKMAGLLRQEGVRVKEAGYAVGYRHPSSFTRAFRRHFGHPPSAYRPQSPLPMTLEV